MNQIERMKLRYEQGFWTKAMVRALVVKKVINADEYEEITGESYGV